MGFAGIWPEIYVMDTLTSFKLTKTNQNLIDDCKWTIKQIWIDIFLIIVKSFY